MVQKNNTAPYLADSDGAISFLSREADPGAFGAKKPYRFILQCLYEYTDAFIHSRSSLNTVPSYSVCQLEEGLSARASPLRLDAGAW